MKSKLEGKLISAQQKPMIGVAAIFKNEFEYVIEWLAHHRAIGIKHFFIADNESNDGTSELLTALDNAGLVHRMPFSASHIPGTA